MSLRSKWNGRYGVFIFAILMVLIGSAFFFVRRHDFQVDNAWSHYTSTNVGISFDYPKEWSVNDIEFADSPVNAPTSTVNYNTLTICPAGNGLTLTVKEGVNNCITFYTDFRLLNPGSGFYNELNIFSDFSAFMNASTSVNYNGFRIMEYSASPGEFAGIGLIGLYRVHSRFIGMNQALCPNNSSPVCAATFQHVLSSIVFAGAN